ncbi:outer membrane murein-binding lipoprotein Lpp [Catalinimonas alkaloidigena]|uniref:cache domain-containing protein n=1 Tax=Catalinimonas alkaloidigena TaxID=1075417 RepID=UPI00240569E6|nr:cache domain-containing protein [Catalinimonas alkaloidigena]MDF9797516.1 outer membrane murein-binding lipoprotein Lpp [Catalinimonas alkaloidigena]
MKIKKKIILSVSLLLSLSILIICFMSIYNIWTKGQKEIQDFEKTQIASKKDYLVDIVDVAYGMIETQYEKTQDTEELLSNIYSIPAYTESRMSSEGESIQLESDSMNTDDLMATYGEQAKERMMHELMSELSTIRFDGEEGYFWITDNALPFPKMLMHAAKPENEGKIMNDSKYNTEKHQQKNIYQARAEGCIKNGEAYVEYIIEKPDTKETFDKLSYSKLFKPLGWIISTGIYIDQVEAMVAAKKAAVQNQIIGIIIRYIVVAAILLIIGNVLTFRFSDNLAKSINKIQDRLRLLSEGKMTDQLEVKRNDELGMMMVSMNNLVAGMNRYTTFAKQIGEGTLDSDYQLLSEEDVLGNELIQMRNKLKANAEDNERRNWITGGLAKFVEILRKNSENLEVLGDEILKHIADYMKVNQGAIYILDEEESDTAYLKQIATYAYGKKKFISSKIEVGEGLVGQCFLEKEKIILTEIPNDYIRITSGLGDAPPSFIAILPLIHDEEVMGILEIASFHELRDYQFDFLEQLCQSISSTVSSLRVNIRTKMLLEESQGMSNQLQAQEEELRQNQEEMQATQEEMARKQKELEQINSQQQQEIEALKRQLKSSETA